MRRIGQLTGAVFTIALILGCAAYAGVVTLDAAAKSADSDTNALEALAVQSRADQVGFYIQNTTTDPQDVTLKITSLNGDSFDVYINRPLTDDEAYKKLEEITGRPVTPGDPEPGITFLKKTTQELEQGVRFSIAGAVGNRSLLACLKAVQPGLDEEYERLQIYRGGDPKRAWYTLSQASDWARSGISTELAYRSASIIVTPAGETPARMIWRDRLNAEQTAKTLDRACKLFQMARARMYQVIGDAALRNSAVKALTPVEFAAAYSLVHGKPHIEAKLVNSCNLPLSGRITMALPKGWKTTAKSLDFAGVRPGTTFSLSFDLVPPDGAPGPPQSVPVAANITLSQVIDRAEISGADAPAFATSRGPMEYTAGLKLKVVAVRGPGV